MSKHTQLIDQTQKGLLDLAIKTNTFLAEWTAEELRDLVHACQEQDTHPSHLVRIAATFVRTAAELQLEERGTK